MDMQEKIANKITSNPEVFENSFLMRLVLEYNHRHEMLNKLYL